MNNHTQIVVLGTGGTIAGLAASASDNLGYTAGQMGVAQLVQSVPDLDQRCRGHSLVHEQVCNIDSKDMGFVQWCALAQRCAHWLAQESVAGLVIPHGSDTIEETAFFLHSVLSTASKPVVLTCAMRPASSAQADGPGNLADSISLATHKGVYGVMVVCTGQVFAAQEVQKTYTYRLNAFCAGDAGPLAYVEHAQIRQLRPWPQGVCLVPAQNLPPIEQWPRVEIVWSYVGASPALVKALCAQGVQGIVVAATGSGTLSDALIPSLKAAQAQGIKVVRASRCALGRVWDKASDSLPATASTLHPLKARIALLLQCLQIKQHSPLD